MLLKSTHSDGIKFVLLKRTHCDGLKFVLLKSTYRDRIDEIVADNFVTDLWLTHPMSHLDKFL